jgi:hypothetical protein
MPQNKFINHVNNYFKRERIYKGHIYLDWQQVNINLANRLFSELNNLFDVSKQAAKIRLISKGLLINKQDMALNNIIKDVTQNILRDV